jgi:hypothetical protein
MKRQIRKPVLCFLTAVAVAAFIIGGFFACAADTPPYEMNSEADLLGLTIANITLTQDQIPEFIHPDDWNNQEYPLVNVNTRTMQFQRDSDVVNVRIRPVASPRSRIQWGIGDMVNRPNTFVDTRVPASFGADDYIYLKVTSEDVSTVKYYRFFARVLKSGTHLADVIIDGKRFNVEEGGVEWDMATEGNIALTRTQAVGTLVKSVAFEDTSTFRFAQMPQGNEGEPEFQILDPITVQEGVDPETDLPIVGTYYLMRENFTDQDFLYIEVTAQNTVDKAYFKFLVSVGRIATIAKLSFDDNEVTGKGIPHATWGSVLAGSFATAHYSRPAGGYAINIELDDDESTIEYAVMNRVNAAEPSSYDISPTKEVFEKDQALVIKITSQNTLDWRYYKIGIQLLASTFRRQPASATYYYYQDPAELEDIHITDKDGNTDTMPGYGGSPDLFVSQIPDALDFELEKEEGSYTYQWYESNSWYGGYGFDVDGRITTSGSSNEAHTWEVGFIEDLYHRQAYDEKANITLFNGGNEFARYVIPGRAISASTNPPLNPDNFNLDQGTSREYTPKINFRPFLPKYSSEIHYYWVVITDAEGYELTSERAVIVSERDNRKKHHVFDTNNYYDPVSKVKIIFKNGPDPFKEIHDKYRIPLHFEGGFNINDYSTVIAQAKFYLSDGTPWVQNWTQGNLSFEDNTDKPDISKYGDVGDIKVLYYNLTNDNAAKGLANGGNEPSGGGLAVTPTHIVIEPSGDHKKGVNKDGFPPLNSQGQAASSIVGTDMQGWFCGFIELVELRFEGPAR